VNEETEGKPRKKPYVKPAVTEIKLAPEETRLAACKGNNITTAQGTTKCYFLSAQNPCRVVATS
jgi:hypothetical protein